MSDLLLELNITEILLVSVLSFIGAFSNRFWKFMYSNEPLILKTWILILINMITVTIISISIDAFIIDIHPRLVLLPPFLLSLVGDELINKLTHIDSSMEMIKWFINLINQRDTNSREMSNEQKQFKIRSFQEIAMESVELTVQMETCINKYKISKDKKIIIDCYNEVAPKISSLEIRYQIETDEDYVLIKYIKKMIESFAKLRSIKDDHSNYD